MINRPSIAVIGAKGFPARGGAARSNEAIFTRLKDRYDITVYAISSHASETNYKGIKQIIFKAYKYKKISVFLYYIKSLLHALFRGKYDLAHVNHRAAGFLVPFLRIRYPVILNIHGLPYHIKKSKWKPHEKFIFYIFQRVGFFFSTSVITVQKGSLKKIEMYQPNVQFIPNGVDDNYKLFLSGNNGKKFDIVFSAARIYYLKGLHLLLTALNDIEFGGRLLIIGDLNQDLTYHKAIREQSKNLNCNFTGIINDNSVLFKKIAQSKLLVFPSYSEGMSNMLLEVVSIKVPVIASNIPQNTEVFGDDEMLFFQSGDSNSLKNSILFAFDNYDAMLDKAEKAYQKVIINHDWDKIANDFASIYEKHLKKNTK